MLEEKRGKIRDKIKCEWEIEDTRPKCPGRRHLGKGQPTRIPIRENKVNRGCPCMLTWSILKRRGIKAYIDTGNGVGQIPPPSNFGKSPLGVRGGKKRGNGKREREKGKGRKKKRKREREEK